MLGTVLVTTNSEIATTRFIRKLPLVVMFGILCIDKSPGMTSRQAVNHIQRLIRPCKVGHSGTLDPMATGVLLIPVGQALRLVEEMHLARKFYCGRFRLGATSDSADTETVVREVSNAPKLSHSDIEQQLPTFLGEITQQPPTYSAVHINGNRAYDLARAGKSFEMPKRTVTIHSLQMTEFAYPFFELAIECSTGTYIRSLGRDIARKCGSDAVMTSLRRTRIGSFTEQEAISLDVLDSKESVLENLRPVDPVLESLPCVTLNEDQYQRIRNGLRLPNEQIASKLESDPLSLPATGKAFHDLKVLARDPIGRVCAVLERKHNEWKAKKNLNLP